MQAGTVATWMRETAETIRQESDHLTQLDAAIGDGDHGVNMRRGFDAVEKAIAGQDSSVPPGRLLILSGKTLVSTVGGASGPLWGSGLRHAGRKLGDAESFDGSALAGALDSLVAAVKDLGAASLGDKTMVDALEPAAAALKEGLVAGHDLQASLDAAAAAADEGARATVPMQARKGRASYLGERSIGHQDPGATSVALVMRALARAVSQET